jgi:MFS family permease
MDRFGARRVTIILAATAAMLFPLYPALPFFPALLALQLVTGCLISLAWSGGQTLIALIGHGEADYIGRYTFFGRFGTTLGPVIVGAAWDLGGKWPAYLCGTAWGLILIAALLRAPDPEPATNPADDIAPAAPQPFRLRDLLPRLSDYTGAFAMLAIPAVAVTIAVLFLRNSTGNIQSSVYVVYLEDFGMPATTIGVLLGAVEVASALGNLVSGRTTGRLDPQWTLVASTAIAIVAIMATPLLGGVFILLLAAQAVRGLFQGMVQPVLFSLQSKSVGRNRQGAVVGLRQTMNRLASIIVPPLVGAAADRWGVGDSFMIVGGGLLAGCVLLGLAVRLAPRLEL